MDPTQVDLAPLFCAGLGPEPGTGRRGSSSREHRVDERGRRGGVRSEIASVGAPVCAVCAGGIASSAVVAQLASPEVLSRELCTLARPGLGFSKWLLILVVQKKSRGLTPFALEAGPMLKL